MSIQHKVVQDTDSTKKFNKLLNELGNDSADEQKRKIEEMNYVMEEIGKENFESLLTGEIHHFSSEFLSICTRCLVKYALRKEEKEEKRKEVEMALLAINSIHLYLLIEQEVYIKEITVFIWHLQELCSMALLANQST
ncbi:uncharacterized protein MONOS_17067 [Monocercomonoides exilis]|uniref:uncharacterized protein n=1 Tax=Monocercomonoides exilis TaxID=2049356 RepID=UPI00355A2F9E|nr:hypothetical protein MONOS_17067 [Monocercomonoides exilis]